MNKTTELLNNEIYPRLFEQLDTALPEFDFKRTAKGWIATNGLKVTGEEGEDRKVSVLETSLYWIGDWTRKGKTIWDYIQERDGLAESKDVLQRLAELANYTLSNDSLSEEAIKRIEAANKQARLWEDANTFFINCLSQKENTFANTPGAQSIRDYLTNTRGYHPSVFLAPGQKQDRDSYKMEVGYVPSQSDFRYHLKNEIEGHSANDVNALIPDTRIGDTHRLAIPYRDPSGRIRGMVFRSTTNAEPKYLYSAGLEKKAILFNLKAVTGQKDLVIVEGVLDALHATAVGIPNVVAIGGSGGALTAEHIEAAIKYGAKKITLLLDNDRAGIEGADKALELLLQFPRIKPYVAFVDEQHKDLDSLLTTPDGVAQATKVISEAAAGWAYLLQRIIDKYAAIQDDNERDLTYKEIEDLKADLVETSARLPTDEGEAFLKLAHSDRAMAELGVSEETLNEMRVTLRKVKAKEQRNKDAKKLLNDAQAFLASGQEYKALDLLQSKSREIKESEKANSYAKLLTGTSEHQIKEAIKNRPPSLECGFTIEGEPLMIPAAGISIMAAGTSHGKSVMLANLAINMAQQYEDKTFHIFSYEVDQERYIINLLNPFIGEEEMSDNNRESLEHYFRGKNRIVRRDKKDRTKTYDRPLFKNDHTKQVFDQKRAEFFSKFIDSGQIKVHYVTYDSDELIDAIRYINQNESVGAVLVDYVQLIYTPTGKLRNPSRQEEIKQMCIDFKDLALETGLPLIFAAQFNREVDNLVQMHATKLGEAGDLERIADLILGIWNNRRKWNGTPSKAEMAIIQERVPFVFRKDIDVPDPKTWYVEVLKRRGGEVEVWDIWDYSANAGKVTSNN